VDALIPVAPFVALLLTRWRWVAAASAVAGFAVGFFIQGFVIHLERGWFWWLLLGYASLISLAMAIAETLVAAVLLRGRFFRGLLFAVLAHAAWLAWLFATMDRGRATLVLVQTAMLGAAAATWGARRADR
jgi:hypothetical protein